ncbi:MAG: HAD family hydrolase [Gemmataceae bacterium]
MLPWAVLWDMDGTLVDTAELHFSAWRECCARQGRDFTEADFQATFGRRNPEILRFLLGDHLTDQEVASLGEAKELLYRAQARKTGIELLPGARELLTAARDRGAFQGIGSSAPRANLDLILELTDIGQYLNTTVGMEDTSRGKPDPEVFLIGAQRLGVDPARCVVMEDAVAGIQAATAGGMQSVAVRHVGHHPAEALRSAGATLVVECLTELDGPTLVGLIAR